MVPTKKMNPAGFLVEVDGKKILLDAGHGTIRRVVDFGFNIQDIDYIFISHFHTDHFGDAFNLVHSRWVDDIYKGKNHKGLVFLCPPGTEKRFKLWRKIYWVEPNEFYPVKFFEGARKIKIGKIQIEIFPVHHVKWFKSVGIAIKYSGKKLVYTGDIGSRHDFNALVKVTKGADLLITEANYEIPTPNHYTAEQIIKLVLRAKIDKVLVVHVRPHDEVRVRKICQKHKDFIFGRDGLRLKV